VDSLEHSDVMPFSNTRPRTRLASRRLCHHDENQSTSKDDAGEPASAATPDEIE
jgi:hypothetical protein